MLPQVRDPIRRRSVAKAAVSPSAAVLVAAGAGVGIGVHSVVLAVVLGAAGWVGRVTVAAVRSGRRGREKPQRIDPWAVPEPWRTYVSSAVSAGDRFERATASWPAGPLRERLADLKPRMRRAVEQVWVVANRGATLSQAGGRSRAAELSVELKQLQSRLARDETASTALDRREEAIAAELRSARRGEELAAATVDRLRILTAQLDEAVARVLELGFRPIDQELEETSDSFDRVIDEIVSLSAGLDEASGSEPAGRAGETGLPPPAPHGS